MRSNDEYYKSSKEDIRRALARKKIEERLEEIKICRELGIDVPCKKKENEQSD
jgi:hypothetical protein